MIDGKMITLSVPTFASEADKQQSPLDQLPFYFPIPPVGDFTRRASASHSENAIIRRGVVSQFGGPDLEEISWGGEFPVLEWFTNYDPVLPNHVVPEMPEYVLLPPPGYSMLNATKSYALLREIMQKGIVVRLMVEDIATGKVEVDMPVTIRDIEWREEGGEPDTRFYNITFRQFRYTVIRTVPRGGTVPTGNPPRPKPERMVESPYIVKRAEAPNHYIRNGKGFWCMPIQNLAFKAYRDKSMWKDIVAANGGVKGMSKKGCFFEVNVPNGPWLIPVGTRIVIPGAMSGIGFVPPGTPAPVR